jgi:hypothetical protein
MSTETEQAIRNRAYSIWEDDARPSGKDVEHWKQAEIEILSASQASSVPERYRAMARELLTVHMQLMKMEEPLISQSGPHRRLSTIIRSTAALLMVPINLAVPNSIGANLHEDSDLDYQHLLISIYRCTMTGAHIYFEESLLEWCEQNSIHVANSMYDKWASIRSKLVSELTEKGLKQFDRLEPNKEPSAPDVLNAAVSILSPDRAKMWLDYLSAVAVIRNKLSHSRPTLSPSQQERLCKADMGSLITNDGLLHFNAFLLPTTIQNLINFLREIETAFREKAGR